MIACGHKHTHIGWPVCLHPPTQTISQKDFISPLLVVCNLIVCTCLCAYTHVLKQLAGKMNDLAIRVTWLCHLSTAHDPRPEPQWDLRKRGGDSGRPAPAGIIASLPTSETQYSWSSRSDDLTSGGKVPKVPRSRLEFCRCTRGHRVLQEFWDNSQLQAQI